MQKINSYTLMLFMASFLLGKTLYAFFSNNWDNSDYLSLGIGCLLALIYSLKKRSDKKAKTNT